MAFDPTRCERIDHGDIAAHRVQAPRPEITLDDGTVVSIVGLHQAPTYDGMLCGSPTSLHTQRCLDEAVEAAGKLYPYLPIERAAIFAPALSCGVQNVRIPREEETTFRIRWETLPAVRTIAVLREQSSFRSVLAIWWQDQFGYPDSGILEQIRSLDWADHVVDFHP